jgi:hypothetical protein
VQDVVGLALGPPPGEATHWTGRMLAKAAGVSLRSVQRMRGKPVGLREVDRREFDVRLHQSGHEMDVAGETVEPGDDQRGAERPARLEGRGELRPVGTLARLHLDEFADDFPVPAVQVGVDGGPPRVEAKARATLALRRHPVVSDEGALPSTRATKRLRGRAGHSR